MLAGTTGAECRMDLTTGSAACDFALCSIRRRAKPRLD